VSVLTFSDTRPCVWP